MTKAFIYSTLFFFLGLSLSSCKSEDQKLDLLLSGGGGGAAVDQLEFNSIVPDQAQVVLEIGEYEDFSATAVAPIPRVVSYAWFYDGSPITVTGSHRVTAASGNVGNHTLKVIASDGETTKEKEWSIKVNGPPVITAVTTGTPAVAVGSTININATATDPNGDSLTYTWLLNNSSSTYLTGTTGTGSLTGHNSLIGQITVTLQVSDGTATSSQSWTAEVNHFPQACNELSQGEICTYSGGPHKGSGLAVNNTQNPLRFRPFTHVQDALGNFFISDLDGHVVWYWNRTGAAVSRIGSTVPANTIQVVAGTGEQLSGATGIPALTSALNNPRGLWYNDGTGTLYVAEYSGSRVKYINSAGTVFIGMGGGTSQVDGDTAYNTDCNNPVHLSHYNNSLYVSCYGHHRVKRWDLASDLGYNAAGDGGADIVGEDAPANTSGMRRPYGLYVDVNGIYIGSYDRHVVRFVNHSGGALTFWNGNPDQVIVNNGNIATIIGDGGTGEPNTGNDPLSESIGRPVAITVRNGNEIYVAGQQRDDLIMVNNSGVGITIDGLLIPAGRMARINHTSGGYTGDNNITNTRINDTYGLSVDVLDNDHIILSDYTNYRLREMDVVDGNFYHLAGSGEGELGFTGDAVLPTQNQIFNYPTGLQFEDSTRTLFFADQNNHRMRQTDAYGRTSTALCRGGGDPVDGAYPSDTLCRTNINGTNAMNNNFSILPDGSVINLNSYGHNVRVWNRSGSNQTYFGTFVLDGRVSTVAGDWSSGAGNGPDGPALSAQFRYPNSAKVYSNGGNLELWILDTMNHCVRMVDNTGTMTSMLGLCGTAGSPQAAGLAANMRFNRPRGMHIDSNGNVYVSDYINHTIVFWNRGATPVTIGTVTVNPGDANRIACLTGSGGSSAESVFATTARCNQPVALDMSGNDLCFAQRNRHNVRCIDITTGLIRTVAGRFEASPTSGSLFDYSQEGIPATTATLSYPSGIAFDNNGDLYISDTYNHVIRKVKLSP